MLYFSVQGWSLSWKPNVVTSNFNYSQLHNHRMGLCSICRKWAYMTDWLYVRVAAQRTEWKWEVKTLMVAVQSVNEITHVCSSMSVYLIIATRKSYFACNNNIVILLMIDSKRRNGGGLFTMSMAYKYSPNSYSSSTPIPLLAIQLVLRTSDS